jgi:hypothetical protein
MRLRSPEDVPVPRIDMTENGILLRKDVHSLLASGQVAFIKVRNFGTTFLVTVLTNLRHQTTS